MRQVLVCVSVVMMLAVSWALGGEPAAPDFHARLTPGETVRFGFSEVYTLANVSEHLRGGRSEHTYQTDVQVRVRTVESDDSGARVELAYERVRFVGQSTVLDDLPVFDSAMPAAEAAQNPYAPVFLPLIEKPIVLRVGASGLIESVEAPTVDVLEIKYAGVARQMMEPRWITERFQPMFSLCRPADAGAAGFWTVASETAAFLGSHRTLRIKTLHALREVTEGSARIELGSKASLTPADSADAARMTLDGFSGNGAATWDVEHALLSAWKLEWSWALTLQPQEKLTTGAEVKVTTILSRLKQ